MLARALVFPVDTENPRLVGLLKEFRLVVNKAIRIAEGRGITSLGELSRLAYADLGREHDILRQYISAAFRASLSLLKGHRRRLRAGKPSSVPYVRRLMLNAESQAYTLNRKTGMLRLPIRARDWIVMDLHPSLWHRGFLEDPSWRLGRLIVVPGRVVVAMTKEAPPIYEPSAAIALDTNEGSLDGVVASGDAAWPAEVPLGDVRQVQLVHFRRRRALSKKKARDRRVCRALLSREGERERNRVRQRLHRISKQLVQSAKHSRAAIVLEALHVPNPGGRSHGLNRRLSSWPRREIHRQIEYKAALAGVPVVKVDPKNTSKTCPACGEVKGRRERTGKVFTCGRCGWRMDRQRNAGLNILKTALAADKALARAVRFQPGALRDDAVNPLYDLPGLLAAHGMSRAGRSRGDDPVAV